MLTALDQQSPNLPPAVKLKREFRDAYERRAYARSCLLSKRLLEDPSLLQRGRAFLDRFVKGDPHQRRIYDMWSEALGLSVDELVAQLMADNAHGAALRETAPVFVVISADEVRKFEKSSL